MATSPPDAAPTVAGFSDTVSVSLDRLLRLEACEARGDLQARHIALLQKQIAETDAELKLERARGEKHAEALVHMAQTCDERVSELKEQYAAALRIKDAAMAKVEAKLEELVASHAVAISKLEAQHKEVTSDLEIENAALKVQAASTLTEILAAVSTGAMEILPFRSDKRQFVEWHVGRIPPPPPPPSAAAAPPFVPRFDRAWCAAASADGWKADVDAASGDVRAKVTHKNKGTMYCTLRSAAPLPRGILSHVGDGGQQQQAYRVVVEAYGSSESCYLGLVPGARRTILQLFRAGAPNPRDGIHDSGGWYIRVHASAAGKITRNSGWDEIPPADSAHATTAEVPPVPAGGAVEFAVDYVAGSCRLAFYTPAAVAGGFVKAPHAKMELRFVATTSPARSVPSTAHSDVPLYPAVETAGSGTVWRFIAG
jgi:hypothetical protein